jgi:hypothetical protein
LLQTIESGGDCIYCVVHYMPHCILFYWVRILLFWVCIIECLLYWVRIVCLRLFTFYCILFTFYCIMYVLFYVCLLLYCVVYVLLYCVVLLYSVAVSFLSVLG